jgi:hypothetical protein
MIDERRLAMIDVCDDRDISYVQPLVHLVTLLV